MLMDGRPIHVRAIRPTDADRLHEFHSRLSDRSVYYRFFGPKSELTDGEVAHLVHVDHRDRFALVAVHQDQIIGVGRYDFIPASSPATAEVAFVVADAVQGQGLGSLLLEHLAAVARDRGIEQFEAEVLRVNQAMLSTFRNAGYVVTTDVDTNSISVNFEIASTRDSLAVMYEREQRADRRNMEHLLSPSSAFVYARGTLGNIALRNIIRGGYVGNLGASWPADVGLSELSIPNVDLHTFAALHDQQIDLIITDASMVEISQYLAAAPDLTIAGILALSDFIDPPSTQTQVLTFLEMLRVRGIRLIGPSALGLMSPVVLFNASLIEQMPRIGRIGFFCQSGALGRSILERIETRSIGLSYFLSAGHRLDVSGNDALQFWQTDEYTDVILLYLETLGNPEKFLRLVKQSTKPIIMVRPPGAGSVTPRGHVVPQTHLRPRAIEALLVNAGVTIAQSVEHLLDIASLLVNGVRTLVGGLQIVSNSDALAALAMNIAQQTGIQLAISPIILQRTDEDIIATLQAVGKDAPGGVLLLYVSPVDAPDLHHQLLDVSSRLPALVMHVHSHHAHSLTKNNVPCFRDIEQALFAYAAYPQIKRLTQTFAGTGETPRAVAHVCDLASLLAMVDLVGHVSPDQGPWEIELYQDAVFGPILHIAPDQPLARALDLGDTYACPFDESEINGQLLFDAWSLPDGGLSNLLAKLSRLLPQTLNVDRLHLRGVSVVAGVCRVASWSIEFGQDRDVDRVRRMSTTFKEAMKG